MNTPEQEARDILERMGVERAQEMTASDVVEIANLVMGANDARFYRTLLEKYVSYVRDCEGVDYITPVSRLHEAGYPFMDFEWGALVAVSELQREKK